MSTRAAVALAGAAALTAVGIAGVLAVRVQAAPTAARDTSVSLSSEHQLLVVSTASATRGHVLSIGAGRTRDTGLACNRFYAASGVGVCLRPDGSLPTYEAAVLGPDLKVVWQVPLVGLPNRARVSPDGRFVAWTVFVAGDSYNKGRFSTRAGLLDLAHEELLASLEDLRGTDGPTRARDRNFWGVTFGRDDRHVYATMSTGGRRYLVRGDLQARTVLTLRAGVECPSLSPDGTRLAFKSAVDGDPRRGWRLSVLDLSTGAVTPLAEHRSVDDQAGWLDDRTVAYALTRRGGHADVWSVRADGSGASRLLVRDAESPSML